MEQGKSVKNKDDGWDTLSNSSNQSIQLIRLYTKNQGRSILQQQYSLEPDMICGWMPKLPSCPIPLTYQNDHIHSILQTIDNNNFYQVVYRGPRHINSVQLHKHNSYRWKYREKYQVKLNLIEQAIENVGKDNYQQRTSIKEQSYFRKQSQIVFSSNFQSGNLDLAIRIKPTQFDCFIRSDTNTKGHTNWYYFTVKNNKYIGPVQLNLCNIAKPRNLYHKGMTPYTCHKHQNQSSSEWKQNQCYDVKFLQRLCRYDTNRIHNQLQFKYEFKQENMEVSFAYSIPYTYSYLQSFLSNIQTNPLVKVSTLSQSLSGLSLPLITISNQEKTSKSNLVIVARIHPGQTNSSHMLQGFIHSLLQQNQLSHRLLSSANFYIIPMLNPDGVAAGNYRTSFSGRDLNRMFNQIGAFPYPQINSLVDFINKLKSQRKKVEFFFDFHSHSSKKDLFTYGPEHSQGNLHYFRSRIFAKILQKQHSMFNYQNCIYTISEHKKSTARAYMLRKENIPMTFTMEVSNGLYSLTKDIEAAYDKKSLHKSGEVIMYGLAQYFSCYHRDVMSHRCLKLKKGKEQRPSYLSHSKSSHQFRKSVGSGTHSQDISIPDLIDNYQIKHLLNQIIQERPTKEEINQLQSDSESSQHDIPDQELNHLFSGRKQFFLQPQANIELHSPQKKFQERISLKRIKDKKEVAKSYSSLLEVAVKKCGETPKVKTNWNRYRKNRIYYEQTHPRASKKVYQNLMQSKKPIKQKKFPILFQ